MNINQRNKPIHIDSWNVSHYSMRGSFYPIDVEKISQMIADETTPEPFSTYTDNNPWPWQNIIKERCIRNILSHIFMLSKTSDIFAIQEPALHLGIIHGDEWISYDRLKSDFCGIWNYKNPEIFENELSFLENIEKTHTIVTSGKGQEGMMTLVKNTYTVVKKVCATKNDNYFRCMMGIVCVNNITSKQILVINLHLRAYKNEIRSKQQLCQKLNNLMSSLSFSEPPEVVILGDLNWKENPDFYGTLELRIEQNPGSDSDGDPKFWCIPVASSMSPPKTTNSRVSEKWSRVGQVDEYSDYIITSFPIEYEKYDFSLEPKFPASDHRHISARSGIIAP